MLGLYCDHVTEEVCDIASELNKNIDTVIFTNSWGSINNNQLSVLNSVNVWGFRHSVIALDAIAMRFLLECPMPSNKLILVKDYHWHKWSFEENMAIYTDPNIKLLVTQPHDEAILKKTFHNNVYHVPALDFDSIKDLIHAS